jgi:hypothetical protein
MTDLALEYTGGINAPDPSSEGYLTIVDSSGVNLRYGRDVRLPARAASGAKIAGASYIFEMFPRVFQFNTTDAAAQAIATVDTPNNTLTEVRITYLARTSGDALSLRWMRKQFINLDGTISAVGSVIDEQTAIDPTTIGGVTLTNLVDKVQVNATGKASTNLFWTLTVQTVSQLRINR